MMQAIDVEKLLRQLYDRYEDIENDKPVSYAHDYDYYCGRRDELDYITEYIVKEQKTITVEPVYHGRLPWSLDS